MTPRQFVMVLCCLLGAAPAAAQEPVTTPFRSDIEVTRILTEVRVVGPDGEPVTGLGPEDFEVEADGVAVEVEAALWVPTSAAAVETARETGAAAEEETIPALEGRLVVILFQVDPGFHPSRTSGLMRMAPRAAEFLDTLGSGDRTALLVFRSHLQLRADFTPDHALLASMLTPTEILEGRAAPPPPAGPFLAAHLDPAEARDAADLAQALELIGLALQPIDGPKSLVLFGYALGRMSAGWRITIDDSYRNAMEALSAARTSVFALDVTDAASHSLEKGLRSVAEDTGGFYVKTHEFPELAMDRLTRVISSYYELSLVPPAGLADDYRLKVRVDRPRVEVHVRQNHAPPWAH